MKARNKIMFNEKREVFDDIMERLDDLAVGQRPNLLKRYLTDGNHELKFGDYPVIDEIINNSLVDWTIGEQIKIDFKKKLTLKGFVEVVSISSLDVENGYRKTATYDKKEWKYFRNQVEKLRSKHHKEVCREADRRNKLIITDLANYKDIFEAVM